ncbi:MAG: AraC family transcriptional regulator [Lachnospiraceae bacterium]|nr:AraC family transcriptional regulator [Lachnospiraceae bacterium]
MKVRLSETGFDYCAFLDYDTSNDFCLYEIGNYNCPPGYGYGPTIRPRCIFHFVTSGSGTLYLENNIFRIGPRQGFLIPANKKAYYEASVDDPWSYIWFHIDGDRWPEIMYTAGLDVEHPVFIPSEDSNIIEKIYFEICENQTRELFCIGKLYELCDYISNASANKVQTEYNPHLDYVKKSIKYIQLKYSEPLHVDDIANICGLNRSYLSRLFKDATGSTLQQYLITYRMKMAIKLMKETNYDIQHIAFSVGYCDIFTFSKAFKKHFGIAPSLYMKKYFDQIE